MDGHLWTCVYQPLWEPPLLETSTWEKKKVLVTPTVEFSIFAVCTSHSQQFPLCPFPMSCVPEKQEQTQPALRSLPKTITSCLSHQACDFPALKLKAASLWERKRSCAIGSLDSGGKALSALRREEIKGLRISTSAAPCRRAGCSLWRRRTLLVFRYLDIVF